MIISHGQAIVKTYFGFCLFLCWREIAEGIIKSVGVGAHDDPLM